MATKDALTDPAVYEELETNQKHADFLSDQLREARNEIQVALEMLQSGQLTDDGSGADIIRTLQAGLVQKLKDLDDTTRKTQVLLGLPNVESDAIEVNQLEVDRLGADPIVKDTSYGILARVPKIMVVGGRMVLLSPDAAAGMSEDDGVATSQDENAKLLAEPEELQEEDRLKQIEKELRAKNKMQAYLENQLKAKEAQLDRLRNKNKLLKRTMQRMLADGFDGFTGNVPATEEAADRYIQVLHNERDKIDKLVEKAKQEIRQQGAVNQLLANGRTFPDKDAGNIPEGDERRLYDIDTERSLNKELLAYEQAKRERKRKIEEISQLKADIDDLVDQNEDMREKLDCVEDKMKTRNEIVEELRETEELEVELSVVQKELDKAHDTFNKMKKEEEYVNELLQRQEYELNEYREKFIEAQEKYEACRVVICREQDANREREDNIREDIQSFQNNMEHKLNLYRALPFVLGVTLIQNFHIEETIKAVMQDNTLLDRDITYYTDKTEALLQQLSEHESRALEFKARQMKVVELRDGYEATEHILNKHRTTIAGLNEELSDLENKIEHRTNEIEHLQKVVEDLKENYAKKNFALLQEHERKKMVQIAELNNLDMEIARTRGLMRAERMIILHNAC